MVSRKPALNTLSVKIVVSIILVVLGAIGGSYGDDTILGIRTEDAMCREVMASLRADTGTYATRVQVARIDAQIDAISVAMDRMTDEMRLIRERMMDDR